MTDKPIDQMTADELHLAIAKARGWSNLRKLKRYPDILTGQTPGSNIEIDRSCIPAWPTDISAAMELAEEMVYYQISKYGDPKYFATLYPGENLIVGYYAAGDTAPVAICRAWLAWKREVNNG